MHLIRTSKHVVYLLIPTSNHNGRRYLRKTSRVVYLLIPTSNHNLLFLCQLLSVLYIFWFLHQTTTHHPQDTCLRELYIFWFLHQTTTHLCCSQRASRCISFDSYIKPQPWRSAMVQLRSCISFDSYIKPQPRKYCIRTSWGCISFDSYIKPQLCSWTIMWLVVVYLLIPTSNHNFPKFIIINILLYIFWFLHQTTTLVVVFVVVVLLYIFWFLHQTTTLLGCVCVACELYIFWFLHQTTTVRRSYAHHQRCISFDSYIKPQLAGCLLCVSAVVYLLIPTSNHNPCRRAYDLYCVVYLLIPTSNHNQVCAVEVVHLLYIFWFLHQTTTACSSYLYCLRCISFDSYIKPQLLLQHIAKAESCISFDSYIKPQHTTPSYAFNDVVYLLIPTSNHNHVVPKELRTMLYIFWFLHQTTTAVIVAPQRLWLYIFWFLHQTTTLVAHLRRWSGCISFDSYIKPQPRTASASSTPCCISFDSYIKPQPLLPGAAPWMGCISFDSYIKPQRVTRFATLIAVVYLLIPTSNHNARG